MNLRSIGKHFYEIKTDRTLNRDPRMLITVPIQVDVTHLGSRASSFMPISNLLIGGSTACLKQCDGAASLFVSFN